MKISSYQCCKLKILLTKHLRLFPKLVFSLLVYSSFTLKTDELDNNFLATIKKLFAGKEIEIIIQDSQTDTDYLLKNPANKSHLLASISSLERKFL